MTETKIREWLRDFGYHRVVGLRGHQVATASDQLLEKMLREAQRFLTLSADGVAGPKTIAAMQQPRCGCPDHMRMTSVRVPAFGDACRLEVGVYADWTGIKGISPSHATEVMVANFRKADRFNLRMNMVDDPRDALINIRMGPAKSGVLAWMEVGDGCGWQHQSLFNIDVDWSNELLFAGTNMHEVVGHGAGVGHSPSIGSIMDPAYNPNVPNVIDDWFAQQLRKRYGLYAGAETPVPPTPGPDGPKPEGVKGMTFAEIIAILLPIIIDCIQGGANNDEVAASIRSPNSFQRRLMARGVKKHVRKTQPSLRRRERRAYADGLLDSVVQRGFEASREEIDNVISEARRESRGNGCTSGNCVGASR